MLNFDKGQKLLSLALFGLKTFFNSVDKYLDLKKVLYIILVDLVDEQQISKLLEGTNND